MTSLDYGLDMPYEVQLRHLSSTSATHMEILALQRSPGQPATQHLLTPGVYMVSLTYNGSQAATLEHIGAGNNNTVTVPAGTAGSPRTSAPIKISVQSTTEYLHVVAPSTGGSARATISAIPAATFDEMAESAQGVSVLSEISNLKTTKADKSTLDARVPAGTSLRLDTSVGTRIFAGSTMIHGDTGWRNVASLLENGWTANNLMIRRVGDRITFQATYGSSLTGSAATSNRFFTFPLGFRVGPGSNYGFLGTAMHTPWAQATTMGEAIPLLRDVDFGVAVSREKETVSFNVHLDARDPWPTTLPGIPV